MGWGVQTLGEVPLCFRTGGVCFGVCGEAGTLSLPLAHCFEVSTLEVDQGEVGTGASRSCFQGGPPWTSLTASFSTWGSCWKSGPMLPVFLVISLDLLKK